jgi:phosphatidylglycerol:prolipoprotein diacylglycerol transferase
MLPGPLFSFGSHELNGYFLVRYLTILAAVGIGTLLNVRQGIPARVTLATSLLCVPASVLGARALDSLEWRNYDALLTILGQQSTSIYGGIIASLLAAWGCTSYFGVRTLRFLDGGAPVLALGEAMTRVGCFLGGCCYGVPWDGPWAVAFRPGSVAFGDHLAQGLIPADATHSLLVHPVQLYSTGAMVAIFVYLVWLLAHRRYEGQCFHTFLVSYGALRLFLAPIRNDVFRSTVVFSLIFIAIGLIGLVRGLRMRTAGFPVQRPLGEA